MKIGEKQLRDIVRKEIQNVLVERYDPYDHVPEGDERETMITKLDRMRALTQRAILECIDIKDDLSKTMEDRDKRRIVNWIQHVLNDMRVALKRITQNVVGKQLTGKTDADVSNVSVISGHSELFSYIQALKDEFQEYAKQFNNYHRYEDPHKFDSIDDMLYELDSYVAEYEDMI